MNKDERKELKDRISERKQFLQKVYDFAEYMLSELGTITFREVHSSNTHVKNFVEIGQFRIDANTGLNMYGSGGISIKEKGSNKLLLELDFYGSFDAYDESTQMGSKVEKFDQDPRWQKAILNLIDNQGEVILNEIRRRESKKRGSINRRKVALVDFKLEQEKNRLAL